MKKRFDTRIDSTRKELSGQIVGLRRAVMEYHSSAIGHGVLFTEFEERVRHLEQYLSLPPQEAPTKERPRKRCIDYLSKVGFFSEALERPSTGFDESLEVPQLDSI